MSAFTPAGSGGAPITATVTGVTSPVLANISVPTAGVEVTYTLPDDTRRYLIQVRGGTSGLQLAYISGASGTTYLTIPPGVFLSEDEITVSPLTLYFQTTVNSQIVEILSWS